MKRFNRLITLYLCFLLIFTGTLTAFAENKVVTSLVQPRIIEENSAIGDVSHNDVLKSVSGNDNKLYMNGGNVCVFCHSLHGHQVGCFMTFTEVHKTATFTNSTVTLYYNPGTQPNNYMQFEKAKLPESFTVLYSFPGEGDTVWYMLDTENWDIFKYTDAPYSYIKASDVVFEDEIEIGGILEDKETGISVEGNFPDGIELSVESVDLPEIAQYNPELAYISTPYAVYDFSMILDNNEWQPENGQKLNVSMDVTDLGEEGDDVLVYHVHVNDDGSAITELLGPFDIQNGKVMFELNKFSYILVMNSSNQINNVENFYPVSSYVDSNELPSAGNGQWYILGVYFDTSQNAHLLIGSNGKMPSLDKIYYVTVNDIVYCNPGHGSTNVSIPENHRDATFVAYPEKGSAEYTEIKLKDENGNETIVMNFKNTNAGIIGGVLDIKLDTAVEITEEFSLGMKATTGGSSSTNSFNIDGIKVELHLEYGIEKTVFMVNDIEMNGDYVTVEAGDWVTYKIVVTNSPTSNMDIEGATLTDQIPECFSTETLLWSSDNKNWERDTPIISTIIPGQSEFYYIKVQVKTNYIVTKDTTYTNTATLAIPNQVTVMDTADVVIIAPKNGTLIVTKEVTKEYENDILPNDSFNFTLKDNTGTIVKDISYKITGTDNTIITDTLEDGTFTLKNGQSIQFLEVPAGDYVVTENIGADSKYICSWEENSIYVTVTAMQESKVTCVNKYKRQLADLIVEKLVENGIDSNQPFVFNIKGSGNTKAEDIDMTVTIQGSNQVTIYDLPIGSYTITEDDEWSWRHNPTYKVGDTETNNITIQADKENKITVTNTLDKETWINHFSQVVKNIAGSPKQSETTVSDEKN